MNLFFLRVRPGFLSTRAIRAISLLSAALCVTFLMLFSASGQQTSTFTTVVNPPQGGSLTGAGTVPTGTSVGFEIDPAPGYYIEHVTLSPQPFNLLTIQKLLILVSGPNCNCDPTIFTNSDSEGFPLTTDTMMTVTFGNIFPEITNQPVSQNVLAGNTVIFAGGASGREPLSYQWRWNDTPLPGQTGPTLTLTNVQVSQSGTYSVSVTNAVGATNSVPATLTVENIQVSIGGAVVNGNGYTNYGAFSVALATGYAHGFIFYTLDGTPATFNSTLYAGPIQIGNSCILNVIAYNSDFSQSVTNPPMNLAVFQGFTIYSSGSGGGLIFIDGRASFNSFTGPYPSNSVVTVTALPDPDWTFMGWAGTLDATAATTSVVMTHDLFVTATFGAPFAASVVGDGSVSRFPDWDLYLWGYNVQVSAIPAPGSYFELWAGDASGNENPLTYNVWTPGGRITALFATLPTNAVSLAVTCTGSGNLTVSPAANQYPVGTVVTITASDNAYGDFLGWSGDASGTNNPLTVVMDSSKVITANFPRSPQIGFTVGVSNIVSLEIYGVPGDVYQIQTTTNLSSPTNWTTADTVTNWYGYVDWTDPSPPAATKFYRAKIGN